jgi:voltage-gated potassium channel Kch
MRNTDYGFDGRRACSCHACSDKNSFEEKTLRRLRSVGYRRLALMDYMYFAIYTITTTGYGDIVPTTNYAKALTCFANICEMFFIIGLFNALVALKDARP